MVWIFFGDCVTLLPYGCCVLWCALFWLSFSFFVGCSFFVSLFVGFLEAFAQEDFLRNDPDCVYLSSLNQALKRLWPYTCPQWVTCLRDLAAQKKAERKEKHTAAPTLENTAAQAPGVPGYATASSPGTPEASVETAAHAPGLAGSSTASVGSRLSASRVEADGLFVGDIVVLDNSVGKDFRGQEAQVLRVFPKSVKVTMLQGKGKAKTKNFDQNVCKVVQPSTLRQKTGRQASSEAASAADGPDPQLLRLRLQTPPRSTTMSSKRHGWRGRLGLGDGESE